MFYLVISRLMVTYVTLSTASGTSVVTSNVHSASNESTSDNPLARYLVIPDNVHPQKISDIQRIIQDTIGATPEAVPSPLRPNSVLFWSFPASEDEISKLRALLGSDVLSPGTISSLQEADFMS